MMNLSWKKNSLKRPWGPTKYEPWSADRLLQTLLTLIATWLGRSKDGIFKSTGLNLASPIENT